MPTVANCESLLSRYTGTGETFLTRLNLVIARLTEDGSWPGMTPRIKLPVYEDADGAGIVTLPRQFIAILQGYVQPCESGVSDDNGVVCGDSYSLANADLSGLPTEDPHIVGKAWLNGGLGGVLMVSAG